MQVDSVSTEPDVPYLITETIAAVDGHAGVLGVNLSHMLQTAEQWNLLTV